MKKALPMLLPLTAWLAFSASNTPQEQGQQSKKLLVAGSDSGYVDPNLCSGCHAEIQQTYRHTGMARAFYRLNPGNAVEDFSGTQVFYHQASNRYYKMFQRNGEYYQRRHQLDPEGQEVNVVEKQIHFVLGSGNHGRTYLHRTAEGALLQLPLGWYARKEGHWGMSPGYDRPDHKGFRRRVNHACMFCHNGYPEIEPDSDRSGADPVFPGQIAEGIDCQRCHGPGRRHIEMVRQGELEAARLAVVNPEKLSPERQLEVCLQCHLESTTSPLPAMLRRYDRSAFSFRPGEPLGRYMLHFERKRANGDGIDVNHAGYRLLQSACFKKSSGRLTCTTCHNPHHPAGSESSRRRYLKACNDCHSTALQKLIESNRHTDSEACIECHMPSRRTEDVVHAVMTDHYIQRRRPSRDLLTPLGEHHQSGQAHRDEVVLYYPPDSPLTGEIELYLAVAQVKQSSNLITGIPRLEQALKQQKPKRAEYYFELAEAYSKLGQVHKAIPMYEEALSRQPDYLPGLRSLWVALSAQGQFTRGMKLIDKTLQIAPYDPVTLNHLGSGYLEQGLLDNAIQTLETAVGLDPNQAEAHNNLGLALARKQRLPDAIEAFREAIRHEPNFAQAHHNLGLYRYQQGKVGSAIRSFEEAVRLDPSLTSAHINLGVALARQSRIEEAISSFRRATQVDPNLSIAHLNLARLLVSQGKREGAIRTLREALRLRPTDPLLRKLLKELQK